MMIRSLDWILLVCLSAASAVIFPPSVNDFVRNQDALVDGGNAPKLWVLIVAGSNGYYNYRHQSDAYHAYHIMKSHGVPESQIIIMHYDDIANNTENPTRGIVINHPNGSDVYAGIPKDYVGHTVTSKNFLNILTGNAKAMKKIGSGRVIQSGPNDHVFVNFVDHGAPGLVAFPEDEMSALDFMKAVLKMHKEKRYGKMLLYFEACESGSMFEGLLPKNISVFATTAANSDESSYACYFDDRRQTYLGDVYSVNWMEDTDNQNPVDETIQTQYKVVKEETNTSHVQEFGDMQISKMVLAEFFGKKKDESFVPPPKASKADAIPSEEVYMTLLRKKMVKSNSQEEKDFWISTIEHSEKMRTFVMSVVQKIAATVAGDEAHAMSLLRRRRPVEPDAHECLDEANKFFSKNCFSLAKNEFALFAAPRLLANACMDGVPSERLIQIMEKLCTHQTVVGVN